MIDLDAYLARLGYSGSREPTLDTLRSLHRQHLFTVPFENLNIGLSRPIVLEEVALFDKVVNQRRGGYCYELNGLFSVALRQMGFKVTLHSAGVWGGGQFGPLGDHLCLLVHLAEPWLADVGFGDSALEPLRFMDRAEQRLTSYRTYRVDEDADGYYIMRERRDDENWQAGYRFWLQPMALPDFAYGNYYMQTSPQSHFTQNRVITLATSTGRITLSGLRLITTVDGQKTERVLAYEAEWQAVLKEQFGVVLEQ
jgi:N-hydroxyarylamine O-acetyltransferase